MIELLHTPEGVRDVYGEECANRAKLQEELLACFRRYGCAQIQTPTFEFFDIFGKERGTVPSKDMYKFFDREGNTLVLRPDMTPSIARCAAKYYRESPLPVRLCYSGNTYINNSSYQGRLKETTQLGVEFFNDASVQADAEVLALTADCILRSGIREFQIEVGQADFFKSLIEETGFSEEEQEELRILIKNKNIFGANSMLSKKNIPENLKRIFQKLPEMFGSIETISAIKVLTDNPRAIAAIERLESLYELLRQYGYEKYVSFDLGMLSKYKYYTGIIFRAITYGTGEALASGGRYDRLAAQFGMDVPAIGMSLTLDYLMIALERQQIPQASAESLVLVSYEAEKSEAAIALAKELRGKGKGVMLQLRDEKATREDIVRDAAAAGIRDVRFVSEDGGRQ